MTAREYPIQCNGIIQVSFSYLQSKVKKYYTKHTQVFEKPMVIYTCTGIEMTQVNLLLFLMYFLIIYKGWGFFQLV